MEKQRRIAQELLDKAEIQINGTNPWDIQIFNSKFYRRVFSQGSLGLGESYMDGWWDCEKLDEFFCKALRSNLEKEIKKKNILIEILKSRIFNPQSLSKAFQIGETHYDIGNDLYEAMLDSRMTYTCGYWKDAKNLEEAQEAKLELVCKKIGLKEGNRVLDIGCGWGSFAEYTAENYGVSVLGITVSKEQVKLARERCKGLDIKIELQDYREINEKFDHIVSLGMFEHVGIKNYRKYFEIARKNLEENGLFLLHTIGGNKSVISSDKWLSKYIFPNSMLPSIAQISKSFEGLFVMEDWHNFGADYDKTLMEWHKNFNNNWDKLKDKYDDRFKRMWDYYLLSCAGSFRARKNQLWQIVLSPKGVKGGYSRIV